MKEERILDVLGKVDEKYIKEADPEAKKRRKVPVWAKWGAMAACLCLMVVATIPLWQQSPADDRDGANSIVVSGNGVTIPPLNVSLSNNDQCDMLAFFIYHGSCYVEYEWLDNAESIVGEYLGAATGLIDEWTPEEGYVELAGSVSGDFYSVNGYDPSFMLCMKYDDGRVFTYVCNNGITIKYGSELYEDRLHLSGGYSAVQFETWESWNYNKGEIHSVNGDTEIIGSFLNALNAAEFMPGSIGDAELYHVYFQMDNGMLVHLRLFENGYVRFQGMYDICVQLTPADYNPFLEFLDSAM